MPPSSNILAPSNCGGVTPSVIDQTTGIPNSDLHIYLTAGAASTPEPFSADFCSKSTGAIPKTETGYIKFDTTSSFVSPIGNNNFRVYTQFMIRAFMKLLGFDYSRISDWIDSSTGLPYTNPIRTS